MSQVPLSQKFASYQPARTDDDQVHQLGSIILAELDACEAGEKRTPITRTDESAELTESVLQIQRSLSSQHREFIRAPFIGCVVTESHGRVRLSLISRTGIPDHRPRHDAVEFVSYLAPRGQLAAVRVGESLSVMRAIERVLQKDLFESKRSHGTLDAVGNRFFLTSGTQVFVDSLREFMAAAAIPVERLAITDEATLKAILESEVRVSALRREKEDRLQKRRAVRSALELRDQPILDDLQDPVFRRSISSQLILTGAPGTGKTTVLLRRLSQKTKPEFLSDDERSLVSADQLKQLLDGANSWVLFSPNDLLRSYLREALGREELPVTDDTVRTWVDERAILARDVFRALKSGKRGVFEVGGESILTCDRDTADHFFRFALDARSNGLKKAWASVAKASDGGSRYLESIGSGRVPAALRENLRSTALMIADILRQIRIRQSELDEKTESSGAALQSLDGAVRQAGNRIEEGSAAAITLLLSAADNGLRVFGAGVRDRAEERLSDVIGEDPEETDASEEERRVLGDLQQGELAPLIALIGEWQEVRGAMRRLVRGLESYVSELPRLFMRFRRDRLSTKAVSGLSRAELKERARRISDEELDFLIYVMLERCGDLLQENPRLLWRDSRSKTLERVKGRYRTVVAVDEAPDFSWTQLASMYQLSHPSLRSFSMCGDLMQRTTTVGLRSWSECQSFCSTLEEAPLKRVYRQNPSLLRIAARLYEEARREAPPFDSPFEPGDDPPALLFEGPRYEDRINWVADRIVEIYEFCGQLPTIAVFVSDDAAIDRVARILSERLRPDAINVDACPGGKFSVGDRVRVFAIEYVKGLEFQAAFLVDIENSFAQPGGLALNFVYVAVSRAVMFLGLTVTALPVPLECLRPLLVKGNWSQLSPLEGDETDED